MRFDQTNVRAGMAARSTTGDRLGKVVRSDGDAFIVETGRLFHRDYEVSYDHVTDVRGDQVVCALDEARPSGATPGAGASEAKVEPRKT